MASAVFPTACFACGSPLGVWQHLGACAACWATLGPVRRAVCPTCGLPGPADSDLLGPAAGRCAGCVLDPPAVCCLRVAVTYGPLARRFLLRVKLGGRRELLRPLGLRLAACARRAVRCDLVVPVPSHPWSDLRRGFSSSLELARIVGAELKMPVRRAFLRRRWAGRPSKRLGLVARRDASRRFLRIHGRLDGERVLLVDDVMTTGSALERSARLLLDHGASEVAGAVLARTLPAEGSREGGKNA